MKRIFPKYADLDTKIINRGSDMVLTNLGFEKQAKKLDVNDVENYIGSYYSDKEEPRIRKAITEQYNKRLALRHPILTGIPTLGIAPAVAKEQALEEIVRQELRNSRARRVLHEKMLDKERTKAVEDYRLNTERAKAEAIPRAVIGGAAAWQMLKPRETTQAYSSTTPYGTQERYYRYIK